MAMPSTDPVTLNIIIVGAGIAGFAAAIAFRRAGHTVNIYERSGLNNEIGAAIHVAPNASRGLLGLGLDPVKARFVTATSNKRMNGVDLTVFSESDNRDVTQKYGAPWFFAHRVDLHSELKRLATQTEGGGKPAVVYLRSEVVKYDPEAGSVQLSNGTTITGDLVIAADGVHSLAAAEVLGAGMPALPTEDFAYRFLIPSREIAADPETAHFLEGNDGRIQFYVGEGKRVVWYPCRNNEEQNFVAIFHDAEIEVAENWNNSVDKIEVLKRFEEFHPSVLAVFNKAKEIKQWPLLYRAPISSWHKGRLVLVGDAAHPMLPHQGQGGAQAIEDALALGIMFSSLPSTPSSPSFPQTVTQRLQLFEKIRVNRASVMQIFSNAGQDSPEKIRDAAKAFIPEERVPKNPGEFFAYNFGYDVVKESHEALQKALSFSSSSSSSSTADSMRKAASTDFVEVPDDVNGKDIEAGAALNQRLVPARGTSLLCMREFAQWIARSTSSAWGRKAA